MGHISIRDLQKMSSEKIAALNGPTAVKSGSDTVAILTPVRPAGKRKTPSEWETWAADVERLNAEHRAKLTPAEREAEDALLREWGIDMTVYDEAEIDRLMGRNRTPRNE